MILEFSVANLYSYKDKMTFSMLANNSGGLEENYIIYNSDKNNNEKKILKSAAIYGANASGKTNLFKILTNIILMIRNSHLMNPNSKLSLVPFKFDKTTINKPSEFEIKYITKGIRYVYGFSADKDRIYEEYLYYYPNGRETLIFDRREGESDYPREDKKILENISKVTPSNRFFLNSAANWNHDKCKEAFHFFESVINTFSNFDELKEISLKKYYEYQERKDNELKKFALDCLQKADLNIVNFDIVTADVPKEIFSFIPEMIKQNLDDNIKGYGVRFEHKNSEITLDFEEESKGTQILFELLPFFKEAITSESVIVVDELDRSLHPYLVKMLVNMFHDSKINKSNAQLIFNTHDTNLLDKNLFRRDQIWFTEKNNETGMSVLFSLSDIKGNNAENYEKLYLMGKYGAVPDIDNGINLNYD